jgi:hypothetical protein
LIPFFLINLHRLKKVQVLLERRMWSLLVWTPKKKKLCNGVKLTCITST